MMKLKEVKILLNALGITYLTLDNNDDNHIKLFIMNSSNTISVYEYSEYHSNISRHYSDTSGFRCYCSDRNGYYVKR
jgi:hypothetical protein